MAASHPIVPTHLRVHVDNVLFDMRTRLAESVRKLAPTPTFLRAVKHACVDTVRFVGFGHGVICQLREPLLPANATPHCHPSRKRYHCQLCAQASWRGDFPSLCVSST